MKTYQITIQSNIDRKSIKCPEGANLLQILTEAGVYLTALCAGVGSCGKCKVRVLEGELPVTGADAKKLAPQELREGVRLACMAQVTSDLVIEVFAQDEDILALAGMHGTNANHTDMHDTEMTNTDLQRSVTVASTEETRRQSERLSDTAPDDAGSDVRLGIAIDIGTTTLALALVDLKDGSILDTETGINHQRNFGADVISRQRAAIQGKAELLQELIQKDLVQSIISLVERNGIGSHSGSGIAQTGSSDTSGHVDQKHEKTAQNSDKSGRLTHIVISGNTTMLHLLRGYDCSGLGQYPFTPVTLQSEEKTCENVLGAEWIEASAKFRLRKDLPVTILPGASVYVGADIMAGLLECGMNQTEELSLLLDLGTNGEMAIGNRSKILVTSTAAGPAFEGGNISWGTGSVPGAISDVRLCSDDESEKKHALSNDASDTSLAEHPQPYGDRMVRVTTIGDKPPVGICGTGVISICAALIRGGMIDVTGMLEEQFFDEGFPLAEAPDGREICFTQKDIREIQLAKSAVRAGVELLLRRFGVTYTEIDHVYLAGGFGSFLKPEQAAAIGMIPQELAGKAIGIGNASLNGAIRVLCEGARAQREITALAEKSEEIALSEDPDFSDLYMEHMMFGEE